MTAIQAYVPTAVPSGSACGGRTTSSSAITPSPVANHPTKLVDRDAPVATRASPSPVPLGGHLRVEEQVPGREARGAQHHAPGARGPRPECGVGRLPGRQRHGEPGSRHRHRHAGHLRAQRRCRRRTGRTAQPVVVPIRSTAVVAAAVMAKAAPARPRPNAARPCTASRRPGRPRRRWPASPGGPGPRGASRSSPRPSAANDARPAWRSGSAKSGHGPPDQGRLLPRRHADPPGEHVVAVLLDQVEDALVQDPRRPDAPGRPGRQQRDAHVGRPVERRERGRSRTASARPTRAWPGAAGGRHRSAPGPPEAGRRDRDRGLRRRRGGSS